MILRVIVHIGPPKTGTSAIQNWLQSNKEHLLKRSGFFYPEHGVDGNGVSSGNVEAVFTRDENGELHFSSDSFRNCLINAKKEGAHTLLLSSEFFFKRLAPIFDYCKEAIALAYVRDPLETMESGYNQGVKRHFQTQKFNIADNPKTGTLDHLDKLVTEYGADRFMLRPYDRELFNNGDIVSDFIAALSIKNVVQPKPMLVNPSYVFEALEFKRWFNQIPDKKLHNLLDILCQGYQSGTQAFSLLSQEKRKRVRNNLQSNLERFVERHRLHKGLEFLRNLEKEDERIHKAQGVSETEFAVLFEKFISSNETNQHYVFSVLEEQKKLIKTQSTLIGVCESLRTVRIRKNTPTPILRRLYRLAEDVLKRNS